MSLHHVEVWVPDLVSAETSWGWLFAQLGWEPYQNWEHGRSWKHGEIYVVLEQSPALTTTAHDRCAPGLNHLAFHAGSREQVDALVEAAPRYGWQILFAERHPYAGGPDHYAGYLTDPQGYEVELVAEK